MIDRVGMVVMVGDDSVVQVAGIDGNWFSPLQQGVLRCEHRISQNIGFAFLDLANSQFEHCDSFRQGFQKWAFCNWHSNF